MKTLFLEDAEVALMQRLGLAHDFEFYRAFHDVVSYNWSDHPSITAWLIDKLSGGPHGQA